MRHAALICLSTNGGYSIRSLFVSVIIASVLLAVFSSHAMGEQHDVAHNTLTAMDIEKTAAYVARCSEQDSISVRIGNARYKIPRLAIRSLLPAPTSDAICGKELVATEVVIGVPYIKDDSSLEYRTFINWWVHSNLPRSILLSAMYNPAEPYIGTTSSDYQEYIKIHHNARIYDVSDQYNKLGLMDKIERLDVIKYSHYVKQTGDRGTVTFYCRTVHKEYCDSVMSLISENIKVLVSVYLDSEIANPSWHQNLAVLTPRRDLFITYASALHYLEQLKE